MALDLKSLIAEVPDYPKPGISFKDLTPLLASPAGLAEVTGEKSEWKTAGPLAVLTISGRDIGIR